jgi:hypothetical protein
MSHFEVALLFLRSISQEAVMEAVMYAVANRIIVGARCARHGV